MNLAADCLVYFFALYEIYLYMILTSENHFNVVFLVLGVSW